MAVFEIADKLTRKNEGGYADNKADIGGMTYKGVARKFHGELPMWKIIDSTLDKVGTVSQYATSRDCLKAINDALEAIPELQEQIDSFYRREFWDSQKLSLITSQPVANWIYDHHVNAGARGIMWAQEAARVKADGEIGNVSLAAINAMEPQDFLQRAKEIAGAYRLAKIKKDPSQRQFAKSWLRRDGFTDNEIVALMGDMA